MTVYATHTSTRVTPQSEAIPGKPMVENSAGGYAFAVDDWTRLDRFLILGNPGGTYYASEKKLTKENAECVLRCAFIDAARTVNRIASISEQGCAPKNDPAVFALSLLACHDTPAVRTLALTVLQQVCRIPTHLFQFLGNAKQMRGWGRGLRRAVAAWYTTKEPRELAYQITKYQSREKYDHKHVLWLAHLHAANADGDMRDVLHYAKNGWEDVGTEPHPREALHPIWAAERAKRAATKTEIVRLVRDYRLVRECIPTQWLTEPDVWAALLQDMPLTAMVRNLATMTRIGLLAPLSSAVGIVCERLADVSRLRKSRIHPVALLMALRTYATGRGERSMHTWVPVPQIIDALDGAFYSAFDNVEPTGKRWLFGIDVSGSMSSPVAGTSMSCCEGATAMALVTAHVEPNYHICAFNAGMQPLPITKKSRLDDALKHTRNINGGGTDCALPMVWALERKIQADVFCVLTDNETWAGRIHPCQALQQYRQKTGIGAKLAVVGMTASGFSIADPTDAGMLDVAGFDTAVPQLLSDFA